MATARLRKFIVSVPAIAQADSVARAWKVFRQQGCDQIVVLDGQGEPLGVLRLLTLIPNLPQSLGEASKDWQQTLEQLQHTALAQRKTLLEPLLLLSANQRIDQLQPYLPQIQQHWGILDARHQFVGLVDRLQLLQALYSQHVVSSPSPLDPAVAHLGKRDSSWEFPMKARTIEEQWQTSRQPEVGRSGGAFATPIPANAKSTAKPVFTPDPLVELLERLPIPLMLQTATGQVITQNLAWRQQVGDLQDPQKVRREAALFLESLQGSEPATVFVEMETSPEGLSTVAAKTIDPSPEELRNSQHLEQWNDAASQIPSAADLTGLCRIGTTPHACVCLCPLKNGQERVWQFMKVSMGTTNPLPTPQSVPSPLLEEETEFVPDWLRQAQTDTLPHFKLATLSFHPDPDWDQLNHTESLWLVLAQDITEQQQVAKELAAKNADLVQLNRLKDEFLACISHELKTPLTAVLGLSSLLKDQALGTLNDRQARYAQLIYQSGRHLIQIVNNILDLTRIETGQLELLTEPVSVETVCDRAYEQACQLQMVDEHTDSALPHHPPVRFTLEIQPGLHRLVADELRVRQMLTNLLSNAIKFTPLDGELGLRVEAWDGWIAFTVWDTGIGIPAEKQHLIFQKFQQLESPMTRRFEGTGLGLVLTQRLARLHGGDVTFTSQEDRGSEFTLLLPPSPPPTMSHFRTTGLGQAENRLAIVIEADTLTVEDLSHQLIGLGYRAAIARSGTEALEKIRRLQPRIIFLNPILPLLSGWDVLTLLKADPETSHIPVVITALRVEKELAYQNGANGFLSLPIQGTALQACLDRLTRTTPAAVELPQPSLTVLYFNPGHGKQQTYLADQLHHQHCRVLEVEDLEQADLLARVWKPNVMLLDRHIANLETQLHELSQLPFLSTLPLITLTVEATEAANCISTLRVFPCLSEEWDNAEEAPHCPLHDLLPVIRVAAGMTWTPHVLIVDFSQIENQSQNQPESQTGNARSSIDLPKLPHRPQAIAQYLQIAGLQSTVAPSWQEVVHQLQHHSVNLLLFCVYGDEISASPPEFETALANIPVKPPILVWHPQTSSQTQEKTAAQPQQLIALWQSLRSQFSEGEICTEILPTDLPISSLLDRIQQILCYPIG
ncbi:ATP-binding response regulator [Leptolyngbya ohadii]|uniref:ATP-binding response regulator n=1 Tax=Leptolyngbya ohadii TaxID=1962290 RepID=UPI00117BC88B|nr:ATP-binding protein [Leptolyngbya ohadii]